MLTADWDTFCPHSTLFIVSWVPTQYGKVWKSMKFDFGHFQAWISMGTRKLRNICISRLLPLLCFLKYKKIVKNKSVLLHLEKAAITAYLPLCTILQARVSLMLSRARRGVCRATEGTLLRRAVLQAVRHSLQNSSAPCAFRTVPNPDIHNQIYLKENVVISLNCIYIASQIPNIERV